ncbi:MAG: hypothetical protein JWO03_1625 [Bacteroidetes bacterium]|nr:hypothetical protein [Bacteroidota bacterium]
MKLCKLIILAMLVQMAGSVWGQLYVTNAGVTSGSTTTPWTALMQQRTTTLPTNWSTSGFAPGYIPISQRQNTVSYPDGESFDCNAYAGIWYDESTLAQPWDVHDNAGGRGVHHTNTDNIVYFRAEFNTPMFVPSNLTFNLSADDVADVWLNNTYIGSVWRVNGSSTYQVRGPAGYGYGITYTGNQPLAESGGGTSSQTNTFTTASSNAFMLALHPFGGAPNVLAVVAQNDWIYCRSINFTTSTTDSSLLANISGTNCGSRITAAGVGGTGGGTYTYSWSPTGETDSFITPTASGVYTVTVQDANGTIAIASYNFTLPVPVSATTTIIRQPTCDSVHGIVIANASGGMGTYLYQWSDIPHETSQTAHLLGPGYYSVIVKDLNGCQTVATGTLDTPVCCTAPDAHLYVNWSENLRDTICHGDSLIISAYGAAWGKITGVPGLSGHYQPLSILYRTIVTAPIGSAMHICLTATDDTTTTCDSTICIDVYVKDCCVRPDAHLSINGSEAFIDTICFGDSLIVNAWTVGGIGHWGKVYVDSPDPTDHFWPLPISDRVPLHDPSLIGTTHQVCFVAYDDTTISCADTVCHTIYIKNCCVKPVAVISFPDTICAGSEDTLHVSGGVWGRLMIDGQMVHIDSDQVLFTFPVDTLIAWGGLPFKKFPCDSAGTTHRLCFIAYTGYPDSPGVCSDTVCTDFTIKLCCTKPTAVLDFPDTVCAGGIYLIRGSGAAYGKFYADDGYSSPFIPISYFIAGLPTDHISDTMIGRHKICFIVATDTTACACIDTICKYIQIINCGNNCDSIAVSVKDTQVGPMTFDFQNVGIQIPDFVQWSVDGNPADQTDGLEMFEHTFTTVGRHIVCIHAGYIHPTTDGHAVCCYRDICDTVYIDGCDIMRATDSIYYTYDSLDYRIVHFHYLGTAPTSIIWSFGDGPLDYNDNSVSVTHTYTGDGLRTVCAYVIWSLHDSSNCCCLDTICTSIDISPCSTSTFDIAQVHYEGGEYVFQLTHSSSFITMGPVRWTISTPLSLSVRPEHGVYMDFSPTSSEMYNICAEFSYSVSVAGGKPKSCTDTICISVPLMGSERRPRFRSYPNPTSGDVVIEVTNFGGVKTAKVSISDLTGQVLMTKDINDLNKGISQNYLSVSNLPAGIYLIKMNIGDVQQIEKLVKE